MANVLVRNVPDDIRQILQQRAEQRGQSLQQYLLGEMKRLAEQPTVEEVLRRIEGRTGGSVGLQRAVRDLSDERAGR